ncbi:MAG: hypothetical protein PHI40_05065 [Caldisericia bacterium]|nr:hypothetical protein [Caldisericia bacterium]
METKDITLVGVVSAVGAIFYLVTAPFIETTVPVIGCVLRPIVFVSFIMSRFHFDMKKLLWVAILSTFLYSLIIPCFINYVSLPISIVYVLIVAGFRTKLNAFWLTLIGTIVAFLALLLFTFIFATNTNEWLLYLKYFFPIVILGSIVGALRQKFGKFSCVGCDLCNKPNAEIYFEKQMQRDRKRNQPQINETNRKNHDIIDSPISKDIPKQDDMKDDTNEN